MQKHDTIHLVKILDRMKSEKPGVYQEKKYLVFRAIHHLNGRQLDKTYSILKGHIGGEWDTIRQDLLRLPVEFEPVLDTEILTYTTIFTY